MPDNKNTSSSGAESTNPAKQVQTPQLPTKTTRDDGYKVIVNTPRGDKK